MSSRRTTKEQGADREEYAVIFPRAASRCDFPVQVRIKKPTT
ncbi:MAG: hypothetical protein AAF998_09405 [Bacteroidota bacterium]